VPFRAYHAERAVELHPLDSERLVRMMISRKNLSLLTLLVILAVSSAGCEVVGGIFKAGMWVGVIMVALILVVVFWIVGKMRRS
jgi:uncharacterized membrane protein YcjF (UPF0283 family)